MKIHLDTVGCRLNQSEIETYAGQFRAAGHLLVAHPGEADVAVVNTCSVTCEAAADSRQKIRRATRAGAGSVVATGCWATLEGGAAAALPGVDRVVPNGDKEGLVFDLLQLAPFDIEPLKREPIPGGRLRTRAFIKAQDGCDQRCTFCVTTLARGSARSLSVSEVLRQIDSAVDGGVREVVITGVHLGSWGHDLTPKQTLRHLLETVLTDSDAPRVRVSSLEPWELDPDLFSLWQDGRVCRHLHLPLQSGCRATLRRMARKTTPDSFAHLVEEARSAIPGVAITTDLIAGFPGESEEEFDQGRRFVRSLALAGGHVFPYSERPGTAAAAMADQLPHPLRKRRCALLRADLAEAAIGYHTGFLGTTLPVLWEKATAKPDGGWRLSGLTDNYLRVTADSSEPLENRITPAQLIEVTADGLIGGLD